MSIQLVNDTLKGQLDLDNATAPAPARASTPAITQRLLAMAAAIWHNWAISAPAKRSLTAYYN